MFKSYETELAGRKLVIETGKLAGLANGNVVVKYGDTVVMVNVTASKEPTLQTVDLYPESYLKINPIVINKCKKITQKPTKTLINQITDEIFKELNEKNAKDDIKRDFIQILVLNQL